MTSSRCLPLGLLLLCGLAGARAQDSKLPGRTAEGASSAVPVQPGVLSGLVADGLASMNAASDQEALARLARNVGECPSIYVASSISRVKASTPAVTDPLFHEVHILFRLLAGGCRTFAFERLPFRTSGHAKYRLVRNDLGGLVAVREGQLHETRAGQVIAPAAARQLLKDREVFDSLAKRPLRSDMPSRSFVLFSAGCPPDVLVTGAEDPVRMKEIDQFERDVHKQLTYGVNVPGRAASSGGVSFIQDLNGLSVVLGSGEGRQVYDIKTVLGATEYVERRGDLDNDLARYRVEYALQLDVDVVAQGYRHHEYLDALLQLRKPPLVKVVPTKCELQEQVYGYHAKRARRFRHQLLAMMATMRRDAAREKATSETALEARLEAARKKLADVVGTIDLTAWQEASEPVTATYADPSVLKKTAALCLAFNQKYSSDQATAKTFSTFVRERGAPELAQALEALAATRAEVAKRMSAPKRTLAEDAQALQLLKQERSQCEQIASTYGVVPFVLRPLATVGALRWSTAEGEFILHILLSAEETSNIAFLNSAGTYGLTDQLVDARVLNRVVARNFAHQSLYQQDLMWKCYVYPSVVGGLAIPNLFPGLGDMGRAQHRDIRPESAGQIADLLADGVSTLVDASDVDRLISESIHALVGKALFAESSGLHPLVQKKLVRYINPKPGNPLSTMYATQTLYRCWDQDGKPERASDHMWASMTLGAKIREASRAWSDGLRKLELFADETKRQEIRLSLRPEVEKIDAAIKEMHALIEKVQRGATRAHRAIVSEALSFYGEHYRAELERAIKKAQQQKRTDTPQNAA